MPSANSVIELSSYKTRADAAYAALKRDILDYRLAPGDRFTETEVADRLLVSRTPVREALFRLEREGYLEVRHRNGWQVKPFDFETLDHFYELRIVLELHAVQRICRVPDALASTDMPALEALAQIWLLPEADRLTDGEIVADLDERFHTELVAMTRNPEMARAHQSATERIRIVRRLDFTEEQRIRKTYGEHGAIVAALLRRDGETATSLLRHHIEASQSEVRKITLHRLYSTRR